MSQTLTEVGSRPTATPRHEGRPPRAIAWRLAVFEGRRLLRHPATWLGFLLALAMVDNALHHLPVLPREATTLGTDVLPLVVGVLFVTFLATSRAGRDDTVELFDTAPTSRPTRVAGATGTLAWALGIGVVWTGGAVALLYARGGVGSPAAADLAQPILLVACGAATGVALGSWLRRPVYLLVAFAVLGGIQIVLNGGDGGPEHTLAPALLGTPMTPPQFLVRPVGWHLVYLTGLAGLAAVVAVLRHGASRLRLVAAAVALSLVGAGGAAQLAAQPTFSDLEELVVTSRDAQLPCVQRDAVETCTLAGFEGLGGVWTRPLTTVVAAAPAAASSFGRVRIEQRTGDWLVTETMFRWFPRDQAHAFQLSSPSFQEPDPVLPDVPRPDTLVIDDRFTPRQEFALAAFAGRRLAGIPDVDVASHTMSEEDVADLREYAGLSTGNGQGADVRSLPEAGSTVRFPQRCWLAGQAREVVAVWLAAASSPRYADELRDLVARDPVYNVQIQDGVVTRHSDSNLTELRLGPMLLWSKIGTNFALQLLDIPGAGERLMADWDRWTAPSATTDDLVSAFDLEPLPTWEQFAAEHGVDLHDPRMAHLPPLDPYQPPVFGPTDAEGNVSDVPPPLREEVSSCRGAV